MRVFKILKYKSKICLHSNKTSPNELLNKKNFNAGVLMRYQYSIIKIRQNYTICSVT